MIFPFTSKSLCFWGPGVFRNTDEMQRGLESSEKNATPKHSGEPKEEEAKKALVSFRGGSTPQKRLENPPGLANTKTSQMKIQIAGTRYPRYTFKLKEGIFHLRERFFFEVRFKLRGSDLAKFQSKLFPECDRECLGTLWPSQLLPVFLSNQILFICFPTGIVWDLICLCNLIQ